MNHMQDTTYLNSREIFRAELHMRFGENGPAILTSHDVGYAYVVLETRNSSW